MLHGKLESSCVPKLVYNIMRRSPLLAPVLTAADKKLIDGEWATIFPNDEGFRSKVVIYLGELGKRIFPSHPHALGNSLREIAKYAALAAFSKLGMQPYLDLQKSFAEDLSKALLNLVKYGPCGDELGPELREHSKLFSGKTVRIWKQLQVSMDSASAQFAQTDGGRFSVSEVYERQELDVSDFLSKKRVRSDPGRLGGLGRERK